MIRLLLLLLQGVALAGGPGGLPQDRLDFPGAPTDRYLDAGEVRDVLHGGTEAFFTCFREHARTRAGAGDVSVSFIVERSGRPTAIRAEIGQSPEALGPCLEAAVAALEFGDHDGDPLEVAYPVVYSVDRSGARVLDYPVVFSRPRPVRLPLLELPEDLSLGEVLLLERVLTTEGEPPTEAATPPAEGAQEPAGAEPADAVEDPPSP